MGSFRYERLDRMHVYRGWEECTPEVVMDALCKTYRDAISGFELLQREGVVLTTPYASFRAVFVPDSDGSQIVNED